jgi:16S rRNA G966 N2-methylase RsmD/transcription elongation factor Elf1
MDALYKAPLPATRSGALYSAFPYPTKISPEAIALFIAAHTKPGETIFDGFAGSGTTGLAALLCENPSTELRAKAKSLGLNVTWGARNAVLYELGALGAFVARTLTNPPDPKVFRKAAEEILSAAELSEGWLYRVKDPAGKVGTIRYLIWTDMFRCPECGKKEKLWDSCVSLKPACISSMFTCSSCGCEAAVEDVERITETTYDDVLDQNRKLRVRSPIRVHGVTGKKTWSRAANRSDLALLKRIEQEAIPESVPRVAIPWGDLYRSGYHEGVTHLHHFYTRRNLIAFARLWERTERYNGALRDALRFWLLSYNASHATIMTRVVAKTGQNDLVVTSAQPGVLYVSGLPVEKNIFAGVRRKLTTIAQAFETIHGRKGKVIVRQQSSCRVDLPDCSVDYVFTDPPFGGNIPYAEINFINEAWMDDYTDRKEEIIVSKHQGKSVDEYQALMANAFKEVHRILRPSGKGTVVFHSASADIWNALQRAYKSANLGVERASVLDKTQGSFKQVTTDGAVRGDPVLLLNKDCGQQKEKVRSVWKVAERLQNKAKSAKDPAEQTAQRLYSRLVAHFLTREQQVPVDADVFYQWLDARRASDVNADVYA